jgi:DNA-binding MarR family transcriptional regulator
MSMPSKKKPADQTLRLENQLCFALYSTSLAMTKAYKPMLDAIGLTYPQYLVMLVLWEEDGLMVSEIGERLFLDSGTLTPLLKRMEATGLLARLRDTEDERRVRAKLTATGNSLKGNAAGIPSCIQDMSGSSLSELILLSKNIKMFRQRLMR